LDIIFFSIDEKTLSVSVSFEVNFRSVEAQIILTNHNDSGQDTDPERF
jgi:hypothetical protein